MNCISKKRNRFDDSQFPFRVTSSSHKNNLLFLLQSKICYLCAKEIKKEDQTIRCYCCLKEFHNKCYIAKYPTDTFNKVCFFCRMYSEGKCLACSKKMAKDEITVRCEICTNKYHFKCVKISLYNLLNREYYSNCFDDDNRKFYVELLRRLQGFKEYQDFKEYNQILNDVIEKTNISKKDHKLVLFNKAKLFFVCPNCQEIQKVREKKKKEFKQENFDCDYIGPLKQIHNFNNFSRCYNELSFQISKIINKYEFQDKTTRAYYLVKWKKLGYSIEFGFFLERHPFYSLQLNLVDSFIEKKQKVIKESFLIPSLSNSNVLMMIESKYKEILNNVNDSMFIYGRREQIEEIKNEILFPFFTQLINNNNNSSYHLIICVDNDEEVKKWKMLLKELTKRPVLSLNSKNYSQKILFEMISVNKKINSITAKKINKSVLLSNPHVFDVQSQIIITTIDIFNSEQIFNKIRFNILYFDISNQVQFNSISKLIGSKENSRKVYITSSFEFDYNEFIFNTFINVYMKGGALSLIKYSPTLPLMMVNSDKRYYSPDLELMKELVRVHCGWYLQLLTDDEENWNIQLASSLTKMLKEIPIQKKVYLNPKKILLNLIPISISIEEFQKYNIILSNKMKAIMDNNSSGEIINIIKNLAILTSFPSLVSLYFMNIFKSSWMQQYYFSISKIALISELITQINSLKGDHDKIVVIFSVYESKVDLEVFTSYFMTELEKTTNMSQVELYSIENVNISSIISRENKTHLILFNFNFFSKYIYKFLKDIFAFSSNVIMYQLYIRNSVEENLLKLLYSKFDVLYQDQSFISNMYESNDNIWIIKNNYHLLNPFVNIYDKTDLNIDILYSLDDLNKAEGIIHTNEDCFIYINNVSPFKRESTNYWETDFSELLEPKLLDDTPEAPLDIEHLSSSSEEGSISSEEQNEPAQQVEEDQQMVPQRQMQDDLNVLIKNVNYYELKMPNIMHNLDDETVQVKDVIEKFYENQNKRHYSTQNVVESYLLRKGFLINVRETILNLFMTFGSNVINIDEFCKDFQKKLIERNVIKCEEDVIRLYIEYMMVLLEKRKENNFFFCDNKVEEVLNRIISIIKIQ